MHLDDAVCVPRDLGRDRHLGAGLHSLIMLPPEIAIARTIDRLNAHLPANCGFRMDGMTPCGNGWPYPGIEGWWTLAIQADPLLIEARRLARIVHLRTMLFGGLHPAGLPMGVIRFAPDG